MIQKNEGLGEEESSIVEGVWKRMARAISGIEGNMHLFEGTESSGRRTESDKIHNLKLEDGEWKDLRKKDRLRSSRVIIRGNRLKEERRDL